MVRRRSGAGGPSATATLAPGGPSTGARNAPRRPEAVQLIVRAGTEELQRRLAAPAARHPERFTDAELWVDAETWERARALLDEASALVHDGARPPRTEGTELVNLSLFAFVMDAP